MEYYGGDYIYTVLTNEAAVTDIVDTSIYTARLVPETDDSSETINYYRTGNLDRSLNYFDILWSINCRGSTEKLSNQIAEAVGDALNRNFDTVSGKQYYSVVSVLPTIPPIDNADVYNTPVEINLRRK